MLLPVACRYREVAILRRKNKRLQLDLKSKQQTIAGRTASFF